MPKNYGPRIDGLIWTDGGAYGEPEITDQRTGQRVAVVLESWLDGVLDGSGLTAANEQSAREILKLMGQKNELARELEREQCGASELEDALTSERSIVRDLEEINNSLRAELEGYRTRKLEMELRRKLDVEIASHRANCKLLADVEADRADLNKRLNEISAAFMQLHDMAKKVVGPKVAKPEPVGFCMPTDQVYDMTTVTWREGVRTGEYVTTNDAKSRFEMLSEMEGEED